MSSFLLLGIFCLFAFKQIDAQVRCPDEFQCSSGECISKNHICDGTQDCRDRSDETNNLCQHRSCSRKLDFSPEELLAVSPGNSFRCNYGACIAPYFVCDGLINCVDESDETSELCLNYECSVKEFKCKYGACIHRSYKCNGRRDCADGSDETKELCQNHMVRCNSRQIQCNYGACIHARFKCNGKADCADDSDELPSLCGEGHTFRSATTVSFDLVDSKTTSAPKAATTPTRKPTIPSIPSNNHISTPPPPPDSNSNTEDTAKNLLLQILKTENHGELLPELLKAVGIDKPTSVLKFPEAPAATLPSDPVKEPDKNAVKPPSPNVRRPILFPDSLPDTSTNSMPSLNPCEDDMCRCGPPYEFLCIVCQEERNMEAVCAKIGEENVCDIQVEEEDSVDILSCGIDYHSTNDVSSYQRIHSSGCSSGDGVPILTTVLANCWGTTSMVLKCQPDGQWLPHGDNGSKTSMSRICQPSGLDSQVCGRYQYMKEDTPQFPINKWPFLVGIFDFSGKFLCTGTIIANQWILTAAHCFPRYGESSFNVTNYRIQHALSQEMDGLSNLTEVHLHPNFTESPTMMSDLALLKLSEELIFSNDLFPVCVDRVETVFGKNAATFIRKEGDVDFHWDLSLQVIDTSCFHREGVCSRHLFVGDTQFCARRPDSTDQLEPGSSGGPFLVNKALDNDDEWTIAGVVSYDFSTQDCPDYNVFSSVAMHRSWIDECVEKGAC